MFSTLYHYLTMGSYQTMVTEKSKYTKGIMLHFVAVYFLRCRELEGCQKQEANNLTHWQDLRRTLALFLCDSSASLSLGCMKFRLFTIATLSSGWCRTRCPLLTISAFFVKVDVTRVSSIAPSENLWCSQLCTIIRLRLQKKVNRQKELCCVPRPCSTSD